eukprot:2559638-Prymnesium_polylepis.1
MKTPDGRAEKYSVVSGGNAMLLSEAVLSDLSHKSYLPLLKRKVSATPEKYELHIRGVCMLKPQRWLACYCGHSAVTREHA